MKNKTHYSVKELARMAGVSVRTLHLYDQMGLLRPAVRTEARYRLYGEPELLRLQQILFYRELDIPLQQIGEILDDETFDLVAALEHHRRALRQKGERIKAVLKTIDKTIKHLKENTMLSHEELYEGLSPEQAAAWRQEAKEKYGTAVVQQSENALRKLSKNEWQALIARQQQNLARLMALQEADPVSTEVQQHIAEHYDIVRRFWGTHGQADTQKEAYKGLAELYLHDDRFTMQDGKPQPGFARLMAAAMAHYAGTQL